MSSVDTERHHADPASDRSRPPQLSPRRRLRIVAIGGGTGLAVVLRGLLQAGGYVTRGTSSRATPRFTAIVTVTDDGEHSEHLRRDLGILPPEDVCGSLPALADGRILPSTGENVALGAELDDGEFAVGETAIVARRAGIRRLYLGRAVRPLPDAVRALVNADAIVVGPGSLYTSILSNLLVDGIAATIYGVNAVRIYVGNLMTEPGETDGFTLEDHLRVIREHVRFDLFDYALVNCPLRESPTLVEYAQRGARPVLHDPCAPTIGGAQLVERDLAWTYDGAKIRHAPRQLADAILDLVARGRPSHQADAAAAQPVS